MIVRQGPRGKKKFGLFFLSLVGGADSGEVGAPAEDVVTEGPLHRAHGPRPARRLVKVHKDAPLARLCASVLERQQSAASTN